MKFYLRTNPDSDKLLVELPWKTMLLVCARRLLNFLTVALACLVAILLVAWLAS